MFAYSIKLNSDLLIIILCIYNLCFPIIYKLPLIGKMIKSFGLIYIRAQRSIKRKFRRVLPCSSRRNEKLRNRIGRINVYLFSIYICLSKLIFYRKLDSIEAWFLKTLFDRLSLDSIDLDACLIKDFSSIEFERRHYRIRWCSIKRKGGRSSSHTRILFNNCYRIRNHKIIFFDKLIILIIHRSYLDSIFSLSGQNNLYKTRLPITIFRKSKSILGSDCSIMRQYLSSSHRNSCRSIKHDSFLSFLNRYLTDGVLRQFLTICIHGNIRRLGSCIDSKCFVSIKDSLSSLICTSHSQMDNI